MLAVFLLGCRLLAVTLGCVDVEVDGWSPGRANSGAVARFSALAGDLGSFPSSLQVSKVGWPQLHLSKLNGVLVTFPVEPVHPLERTNTVNE